MASKSSKLINNFAQLAVPNMTPRASVTLDSVKQAYETIRPYIHRTPVMQSKWLNEKVNDRFRSRSASPRVAYSLRGDRQVFLKCENLQKTGSFKPRGMLNAVFDAKEKMKGELKGVITHSTGNAGQALAWSARILRIPCIVVTPTDCMDSMKSELMSKYGAKVVYCESHPSDRIRTCEALARDTGYTVVHPYDQDSIISGQGSLALEFLEQVPDLDAIVCSVGGGGMLAGIALAARNLKPNIKVYGVEPEGKNLSQALVSGSQSGSPASFLDTIADGLRNKQCGEFNWPIIRQYVDRQVFTVTNAQIIEAMKFAITRTKLLIETNSAISIAAVTSEEVTKIDPSVRKIGLVLCGGNVDIERLPWPQKPHGAS